jgi:hypothetical protein
MRERPASVNQSLSDIFKAVKFASSALVNLAGPLIGFGATL